MYRKVMKELEASLNSEQVTSRPRTETRSQIGLSPATRSDDDRQAFCKTYSEPKQVKAFEVIGSLYGGGFLVTLVNAARLHSRHD